MSANDRQIGGDHYKNAIQHWDMIEDNGIGYLEAAATKYVTRWRNKDGMKDLNKAYHYTEKLIEKHNSPCGRMPRGEVPAEAMAEFAAANELNELETEIVYLLTSYWSEHDLCKALELITELMATAPRADPVVNLANKIIDDCNSYDVQTVLTVLSNVVGQIVVGMAKGVLFEIPNHISSFSAAVQTAANNKLLHDDEIRRQKEQGGN